MKDTRFTKLLIIAAIYGVGSNLVHPITPTLITTLGLPDSAFGMLFAAMAAGSFFTSAFWGRLADKRGRLIVLSLSLVGYALAQLAFGLSASLMPMIVARFIGGCFTSGTGIAIMAMIVDLPDERKRASNLSLYAAITSVTSAAGYFIGGLIGTASLQACFFAQAAILILGSIYSLMAFHGGETPIRPSETRMQRMSLRAVRGMLTPSLLLFLIAVALATFGTSGYDNAFNYYLRREYGFAASVNGAIKAATGLIGFAANLFLNRLILRKLSGKSALTAMLSLCCATLLLVTYMPDAASFIAMNIVFYLFNAMYMPIQQAQAAEGRQTDFGMISGLFSNARCLGMIAGPLTAGFLYGQGAKLPFYALAVCFGLAAAVSLLVRPAGNRD